MDVTNEEKSLSINNIFPKILKFWNVTYQFNIIKRPLVLFFFTKLIIFCCQNPSYFYLFSSWPFKKTTSLWIFSIMYYRVLKKIFDEKCNKISIFQNQSYWNAGFPNKLLSLFIWKLQREVSNSLKSVFFIIYISYFTIPYFIILCSLYQVSWDSFSLYYSVSWSQFI